MTWTLLSLREWQRRPLRMSITTMGVALAVAALWSLLAFAHGYQPGLRNDLDKLGAHIIVVPKGCPYDAASLALHGASWPCYLKAEYLKEVRGTHGIAVPHRVDERLLRQERSTNRIRGSRAQAF
jgi:hypothetical protein